MTAADAREQLEAAAWQASGPYPDIDLIAAVLRAADAYARESVAEVIHKGARDERARDRREQLREAAAASYGGKRA